MLSSFFLQMLLLKNEVLKQHINSEMCLNFQWKKKEGY